MPAIGVGLIRLILWVGAWFFAEATGLLSTVWEFGRGKIDDLIGVLQPYINGMAEWLPSLPTDTIELEKLAYTLEQAGWPLRSILFALLGYWSFVLALLALRFFYRAVCFIRGVI